MLVLQINHQRLRLVADGFLIVGERLNIERPFVVVVDEVVARLVVGKSAFIHPVGHFLGHDGGFLVPRAVALLGLAVVLKLSGIRNHLGDFRLFLLNILNLFHVVAGAVLADLCLSELKLGELKLNAVGRTEIDLSKDFGEGSRTAVVDRCGHDLTAEKIDG